MSDQSAYFVLLIVPMYFGKTFCIQILPCPDYRTMANSTNVLVFEGFDSRAQNLRWKATRVRVAN